MTLPPDPLAGEVEARPTEPSLRSATISGTAWTGVSRISQQVVQLGITIVLARMLLPREYGLVAMIVVFTGFAQTFVDSGFGAALVQRKRLSQAHLSSAFWLNLGIAASLSALAAATAPLVARFYGRPQLEVLMPVAGLDFILIALKLVQLAVLERAMLYRRLAIIDNVSIVFAGGVAIACAAAGLGVWSLIIFILVSDGADDVLLWVVGDWRPSLCFERAALRDLWSFSRNLLGANVLNYWTRNGDNLLIGRFVGPIALGLYNRAYSLVLLQLTNVSYVVGRPLFPALSKLQDEPARVRHAYLRATGLVALVTFPIATGFVPAARPLVLTLFGARWAGAVTLMQILAIAAVTQAIASTTGVIFQAQGKTDWLLRWQAFAGVSSIAAFGIGVLWGAKGVSIGVAAQSVLLLYPAFAIPGRLIGMSFADVVRTVWRILAAALLSAATAWGIGWALASQAASVQLVSEVAGAAVVYLVLVHVARLEPYRELREILGTRRSRRRMALPGDEVVTVRVDLV